MPRPDIEAIARRLEEYGSPGKNPLVTLLYGDIPALVTYITTLETAFVTALKEVLAQESVIVIHDDVMDVLDELYALGVTEVDGEGMRRAMKEGESNAVDTI